MLAVKNLLKETNSGIDFAYWGTEWLAFRGNESINDLSWENQSLWDFAHKALPAMHVFNQD